MAAQFVVKLKVGWFNMKKAKKFGRGGDIASALGAGLLGYAAYKAMNKDKGKDKEDDDKVGGMSKDPEAKSVSFRKSSEEKPVPKADKDDKAEEVAAAQKTTSAQKKTVTKAAPKATQTFPLTKPPTASNLKSVESEPVSKPYPSGVKGTEKDPYLAKKPAVDMSNAFPAGGGSKTTYGTDTTSVFQKRAAQERQAAADKASSKAKDAAQAKEFKERDLPAYKKGGSVRSSASRRADGIAIRGKTRA